ncbi:CDP-alcohol phosphatidyltransferase family protein [Candidatus Deianiraea vastatrix]|uniref:Phosphatidylserine synthase n=1 Tax=Candidatus Deianiraea vastatrix TaxID=2163644 RepID=A0A5B8XGM8_9RICK|nr:CDP-alcohol phosphatidyltransferase family protein [Candidatus Deianiraea vastatrix]QED23067.1 Phosphatidylserine synthase [Candidatus Deianiraea vastatrix]
MPRTHIPTIFSMLSVFSGFFAIKYALYGYYNNAIFFIILSAIIDGLDGLVAKKMKAVSTFGGQIDSLCDAFAFGFAPSICLYFWYFSELKTLGWILCFIISSAMIFRLARFNTIQIDKISSYKGINTEMSFVGMPAPIFGIFTMLPIAIVAILDQMCQTSDIFCEYGLIELYYSNIFKYLIIIYYMGISYFAISNIAFPVIKKSGFFKSNFIKLIFAAPFLALSIFNIYATCVAICLVFILYIMYNKIIKIGK